MLYTNIDILCIPKGIPIQYNERETNIETVWGFHTNSGHIQRFTFECDIHPNSTALCTAVEQATHNTIVNVTSGFMFYTFQYQTSFAHYISQTLPLLSIYLQKYPDMKLIIPHHTHNKMQQDIIQLLNIPDDKIIFLEEHTLYHFTELIKPPPFPVCPPNSVNADQHYIYSQLRNAIQITPNTTPHRKIYLKRDGVSNKAFGNSETGITRSINNQDELETLLLSKGFEIVTLGTKLFREKYNALKDAQILISQLGANCTNLLFTNAPKHVLLLSNTEPLGESYYVPLCEKLNNMPINYTVYYFSTNDKHKDATNGMNGPFYVDIQKVKDWIESCI